MIDNFIENVWDENFQKYLEKVLTTNKHEYSYYFARYSDSIIFYKPSLCLLDSFLISLA